MESDKITQPAKIIDAEKMTPKMAAYWNKLASQEALCVQIVDPWRKSLKELRSVYAKGTIVYRASTGGGKWGKSKEIVTL